MLATTGALIVHFRAQRQWTPHHLLRRSRELDRLRSAGVTQVRNARERGDQERDREQDEVIHRYSREVGQS